MSFRRMIGVSWRSSLPILLGVLVFAPSATARAGQSRPPTDFTGTYDLACQQAGVTINVALGGKVGGNQKNWADALTFPLPCEEPDVRDVVADLQERCNRAGLPSQFCTNVKTGAAKALEGMPGLIPGSMDLTVNGIYDFFARLIGIYPAWAAHYFDNGKVLGWGYWLDNNDGNNNGHLVAFNIALLNGAFQNGLACADVALGGVDGKIDRNAGHTITGAKFAINRSLACGAWVGSDWIAGTIGISFHGVVDGAKVH
ncbi:MAG: hypothetical protein HY698_15540 [Deltaproteobacteria bacterium]|nr:hypothetical protein [Deltaproteobacteria bacterium]